MQPRVARDGGSTARASPISLGAPFGPSTETPVLATGICTGCTGVVERVTGKWSPSTVRKSPVAGHQSKNPLRPCFPHAGAREDR